MTARYEDHRRGEPSCPCELKLDLLYHGELAEPEALAIRQQIASCEGCRKRYQIRAEGEPGFASIDPQEMVDKIGRSVQHGDRRRVAELRYAGYAVALAASAAAVFSASHRPRRRFVQRGRNCVSIASETTP